MSHRVSLNAIFCFICSATLVAGGLESRVKEPWAQVQLSEREYLIQVLRELDVPQASQTLVFSKTSHQIAKISPQKPRAIYFNEDYYVGYVSEGLIEVIEIDAKLGARFYTLQRPDAASPRATLVEDSSCISCHESHHGYDVPGLMVRSVFPDASGQPLLKQGSYRTTPASPLTERWGGWWVAGQLSDAAHMGNRVYSPENPMSEQVQTLEAQVDLSQYLQPTSDVLALMILEHQVEFHNLVSQCRRDVTEAQQRDQAWRKLANQEQGTNPIYQSILKDRALQLLKVILFADEADLPENGIQGDATFEAAFMARAIVTKRGRSLRDLQLNERLFKHRCSYMIYTPSFRQLPGELLDEFSHQLSEVLNGTHLKVNHLIPRERERILGILKETAPFLKLP